MTYKPMKFVVFESDEVMKKRFPDEKERAEYKHDLIKGICTPGFLEGLYSFYTKRNYSSNCALAVEAECSEDGELSLSI
jgi:xanthine dehydrogenase iron-sulfur cluster and FAD-binding subunit A